MIGVLLIDDHPIVRYGFMQLLAPESDIKAPKQRPVSASDNSLRAVRHRDRRNALAALPRRDRAAV